jgi:hypothetical protein
MIEKATFKTPPPPNFDVPIVHKITKLYKDVYGLGSKISKRNKFGIYLKVENICLDLISISIDAALNQKDAKRPLLHQLRIKIETLKQLIRAMNELKMIENKAYIVLETQLQEISRMAAGWIKYVET